MVVTFERDIKNQLLELEKEVTDILEESFRMNEDVSDAFPKVLQNIANILHETSLKYEEWHDKGVEDKQFSFFPGYISNQGDRITNNVFINSCVLPEIQLELGSQPRCDVFDLDYWYNESKNSEELKTSVDQISLLSLAYHFLFQGKSDEKTSKGNFSPEVGGTHQWASIVADEIALNDYLDPLELLVFYDEKKEARNSQLKYKTWINIPFELKRKESVEEIQAEILEWCKSVVEKFDFPSNTKKKEELRI